MGSQNTCARCGGALADDAPHVWFDIQSTNLGYDPLDRTELLCEGCYREYRRFMQG